MVKKRITIVGGGLAGTLVANELSKECSVTLLEKGPELQINYPTITYQNKHLGHVRTCCYASGGTTNLWHNGLIPIQERDVEDDVFKKVLSDAKKYRDVAAKKLHWLDNPYIEEYDNILLKVKNIVGEIGRFPDGVDCLLYPKKYDKLELNGRVKAIYSSDDIHFSSNGGSSSIAKVSVTSKGKQYEIESDFVVVSAGALGTPFLVRKICALFGIPTDTIGKGFIDHPMGFVGKIKVKREYNNYLKKLSLLDSGNYVARTAFRIRSECGRYTSAVFLRPALSMENDLGIYKYKSSLGASRGSDRLRHLLSWKLVNRDVIAEIVSHLFNISIPGRVYNIMMINEQKKRESYVDYNSGEIVLDWNISDTELSVYNKMLEGFEQVLEPFCEQININTNLTADWLWSGAHHSGTISLGNSSSDVVTEDLELSKVDNVFVCDGSIVQEHSYANTGLTIAQLALRLSAHILDR